MKLYSTDEVARHSGATFRQLDYWVRLGYVRPVRPSSGSGNARRWSEENLDRVRQIVRAIDEASEVLRAAGLPPGWIHGRVKQPRKTA